MDVAGPTEQFACVHRGGPTVRPLFLVMDVTVSGFCPASRPSTMPVTSDDGSPLGRAPDSSFATDIQDFRVGAEHDPADGAVAGDHAQRVDIDDVPVFGFVEAACNALQSSYVGVQDHVWFLATDFGSSAVVQPVTTQVPESVMAALS